MTENTQDTLFDGDTIDQIEDSQEYDKTLRAERTAVFFCDSRASTIMLGETISTLIAVKHIQRGILDVNSPAGRAIAAQFHKAGLPYDILSTDQPLPEDNTQDSDDDELREYDKFDDPAYLLQQAAGIVDVDPENYHQINANIVVVPAMVGSGQKHIDVVADRTDVIDAGPTTLPGIVMAQCQMADRDVLMIDTPERGLVQRADGEYQRRVAHLGFEASPEATEVYNAAATESADASSSD